MSAGSTALDLETEFEQHRRALTGYCYRMLGSPFDAEDAVQETMIRAWRGADGFEGRSAPRSWLYRIATNVCLDMLGGKDRRARPMDLGPAGSTTSELTQRPGEYWIEPVPDGQVLPDDDDPARLAELSETVRLAFVAILQDLPPRQRAVLVLRDVLHWQASEVADLLGTTVASVTSALQRARATLAERKPAADGSPDLEAVQLRLLERYVDAFESYDIDGLVGLLREDATFSMPPYELWLRGPEEAAAWMLGPGHGCRGSRLIPTAGANGLPAFGQYRVSADGNGHTPWGLVVLELDGDAISGINTFLDTERLFPLFDLPPRL